MIDPKVIEKLSLLDDATILRRLPDSERTFFEYGFQLGYNRALKDLWHPANKMPKKYHQCLIEVIYHRPCGLIDEVDYTTSYLADYGWNEANFKLSDYEITRWLYIDDLLPKKGGKE